MKKIEEINSEINYLCDKQKEAISISKADERELRLLRHIKQYLETNPKPEHIEKEMNLLTRRLKIINSRYAEWKLYNVAEIANKSSESQIKRYYNSLFYADTIKLQIKALKYIIDN